MHEIILITAKYLYLLVGLAAFIYWLTVSRQEKLRLIIFGLIAAIATIVLVKIGAALYYDPRPFVTHNVLPVYPHSANNGFPSDHTALSAFIALTIYSSSKRIGAALLFMAVAVGVSRVVGNIHSPIDIAGSFVFALIGYAVAVSVTPRIIRHIGKSRDHISSN